MLVTSSAKIMTSWPLFQQTIVLRRPGVAIFVDIIKIIIRFIKQIFKDSRKVRIIRNYELKCNLYLYFFICICIFISLFVFVLFVFVFLYLYFYSYISWYNKICCFPVKKCWCQQKSEGMSRDSYIFWIFFRSGITVPSFILVGYVWQILGRGAFLPPPPPIRE